MHGLYAHAAPYVGYVYPNETVVPWGELIVIYPYITGLVAGAFIVSSFYHVFGMHQFRPIARFALLTALCFLLFAPTPLLFHLGRPERAFNAVITPHWSSAMAAFGYVAGFYLVILTLEVWFAFRPEMVARSKTASGALRLLYSALTLGSDDVSAAALAYDHKWMRALAIIGIPSAAGLHGYVGFIFGSLKSREWWSSDLMPIIFLLSAIVSGVALLAILYVAVWKLRRTELRDDCLRALAKVMWAFLAVVLVVEVLEYVEMFYRAREGIGTIMQLINGPLRPGLLIQAVGSASAFAVLTALIVSRPRRKTFVVFLTASASLLMIAVLAMRWNVVIGGQELSKTMKGLIFFQPQFLGREGILSSLLLFAGPFVVLWILARLLPPWEEGGQVREARAQ
ncbi:MAG TPA: NrfD/PsrC family molybdoenzyme membrane anchor subunit [Burkholderiales bacterium]|nr:NrfD/PsrC family molybdoenzyme membrane anchor subunit [Burkholderiales bacterium]